jgi:hypothetical protein
MGNLNAARQNLPLDSAGMRAVAAQLSAAGLASVVHETSAGLELTATSHGPGRREIEVVVDEDGYAELRWWAALGATPADVAAVISRAIASVTAVP